MGWRNKNGTIICYTTISAAARYFKAAQDRFKTSIFDVRQILQADLFDAELGAARSLVKNGFIRAAGVICGVLLERHLLNVCDNKNIKVAKKNPTISDLNETLRAEGIIDQAQWRYITLMADYRNLCGHAKISEPTKEQVVELVDGVEKIMKSVN